MKTSFFILLVNLLAMARAFGQSPAAVEINSELYRVSVDAETGSFTVVWKSSGKAVLTGGKLTAIGGTAKTVELADKAFGKGKGIEVVYPSGNRDRLALYPAVPFVTFRSVLHNGSAERLVLNHVPSISAVVNLGRPLPEIRTLGTGGLLEPEKNPGSYAFLAVEDPASRNGVVGGWITQERGSGIVFSPVADGAVRMQAQVDYGHLPIKPGEDAIGETFALGYFDDARFGLEAYADAIARVYAIKLPPLPCGLCTWYMEKYGKSCDETHLTELSAYAARNLKPFGFDFIQIDDHWQDGIKTNGPAKNFTTHRPNGPFSHGMQAAAAGINKLGLTPGIWFMPFAGSYMDPAFKDHQEWFVKNLKGEPYETRWGGTSLDMTQPGAREYLRGIADRMSHQWGYKLFKLDGFWTGSATKQIYPNNGYKEDGIGDAKFSNPDKTNIDALRDGVKLIRQAAGPDVFLLGCCVSQNMRSFGGSFGLLDGMRVGPDTGAGRIGAVQASRLWFLNGRVWWNDPDCVSVRAATSLEQARLNATFTAMAGDIFYNSDWMPDFPAERLDILRRCMPAHGLPSRPVDVLENHLARIWHLADTRGPQRRDVVALYNWSKGPATISCATDRIGLPDAAAYVGFDFWNNKFIPPFERTLNAELPPGQSCRVLAIRPVSDHPQLLSTSRHITQGMVDVTSEAWNPDTRTLAGTSRVVAGDPYELRIVVPVRDKSWIAKTATAATNDTASDIKVQFNQSGPNIRARFTSASSEDVKWTVLFEPAKVEAGAATP